MWGKKKNPFAATDFKLYIFTVEINSIVYMNITKQTSSIFENLNDLDPASRLQPPELPLRAETLLPEEENFWTGKA